MLIQFKLGQKHLHWFKVGPIGQNFLVKKRSMKRMFRTLTSLVVYTWIFCGGDPGKITPS